tara:strand:- start:4943 stop:6286 length:1344 start_codon:yes stop_codon:yes gene_type:complete
MHHVPLQKKFSFEAQLTRLSLIGCVPLFLLLLWVMIYADISIWLILLTILMGGMLVSYCCFRIYQKSSYQFRSLSNLLEAMIQGEYSLRARSDTSEGAYEELVVAINGLAQRLSQQRTEAVENQLLVETVIAHIDVAILALNEKNQISFHNPAAEKLLLLDRRDADAGLLEQLAFVQNFSSGHHQVVELTLGHQQGRFTVHVEEFRQAGLPYKLLFITDVRTLLRSEERKAWQSLVRVISHEINNSLSPIASISQTLTRLIRREDAEAPYHGDLIEGLNIIAERANGLGQFVDSYKQLTKLPEPQKQTVSLRRMLEKIPLLFDGQNIILETQGDLSLSLDPVQFEQVVINLCKNAVEAMTQQNPTGDIRISWRADAPFVKLSICDQGGGIHNPDNLFVPFYSTKKQGSGIGLLLCRQIIEAHNGRLTLRNKENSEGCCAMIEVPYSA